MDALIAGFLTIDGITNGAVYALLGLAIVLVFSTTRIILIPQGEFVTFGALTLAMLQVGQTPGTVWLLLILASITALLEIVNALLYPAQRTQLGRSLLRLVVSPVTIAVLVWWASHVTFPSDTFLGNTLPYTIHGILSVVLVAAYGPLIYRLAYQSLASSPVLVLLFVSVGVQFALTGLGLLFFGAEGFRNPSFLDTTFSVGSLTINGQSVIVIVAAMVLILALRFFFMHTYRGKVQLATTVNKDGARLMGISYTQAGQLSLLFSAAIGAISGILISPTTTIYYDSGFIIGLKGFVVAVIAGFASYPGVLLGAIMIGIVESFTAFWNSPFKEVVIFFLVLPVLFIRSSLSTPSDEEH